MLAESIRGKSVIVTGASKGIGRGIARVFARHDAKVLVVGRDLASAEAAAKLLVDMGHTASGFCADVTRPEEMEAMAKAAADRYGGVDVLCANAGIFPQVTIENMSPETWDEVQATNLKGTFLSVKACIPYLKKTGAGRIVITSSITGPVTGFPGWSHYGATKAGQLGFMRTACMELAKYGITINAVMPGNIVTEGLEGLGPDCMKGMAAAVPLGHLGDVEDIGHAALFFASHEARYITGQTIIVDGGQILPEWPDALSQTLAAGLQPQ